LQLSFIFLDLLLGLLVKALYWIRVERADRHPCFTSDLRRNNCSFSHLLWCLLQICHTCLFYAEVYPFLSYFIQGFFFLSWRVCWILSKGFFCIYWGGHVNCVLYSVYILYFIYWFSHVKTSLHPWEMKSTWLWHMIFLNVLLNLVCKYYWEFWHLCLSRNFISNFLCCFPIQFLYQDNTGIRDWV
jgi:hypothetical protein